MSHPQALKQETQDKTPRSSFVRVEGGEKMVGTRKYEEGSFPNQARRAEASCRSVSAEQIDAGDKRKGTLRCRTTHV